MSRAAPHVLSSRSGPVCAESNFVPFFAKKHRSECSHKLKNKMIQQHDCATRPVYPLPLTKRYALYLSTWYTDADGCSLETLLTVLQPSACALLRHCVDGGHGWQRRQLPPAHVMEECVAGV